MPGKKSRRQLQQLKLSGRNLVAFVLVFGLIGGYVLLRSFAASPTPPTIYLSPASKTLSTSTNFTVQVRENSGTTNVNAVQANFSYPATLVDFVSIDATGSAFSTEAQSTGGSGQVKIARGVVGGVTGDQLVATVTFKTKTSGGTANMAFTSGTALVDSSTNQDLLGSLSATAGGSYLIDTTAPTVNITSPASGANIGLGTTTTISATASDNSGSVTKVEFYVDGALKTSDMTSPYSYNWSTAGLSYGSHSLQAKATDPSGNVGTSTEVIVNIADVTPPTVSIQSPEANAVINGTVSIGATAADNSGGTGLSKVEFYVDGSLKSTDTNSPYTYSWNTTTATNASHNLTAKAYDNASPVNATTSTAVAVVVDNSAPTAPTNFRTTGNNFTSISLAWNASSDNRGVTGYRITRNGSVITTTSTLNYTDSNLTSGTSYSYNIVALDAAGNASSAASLTVSTKVQIPGDINGDSKVDVLDLSILLSNWETTDSSSDLNSDGIVSILDLSILLSNWSD